MKVFLFVILFSVTFSFKALSQLVYSGIEGEKITPVISERIDPAWCWAACVQLVFNSHGLKLSQGEIIEHSFNISDPFDTLPDWLQNLKFVTNNINKWSPSYDSAEYSIEFNLINNSPSPEGLKKELDNYNPVILLFKDSTTFIHPVVCTAIGFIPGYYGPVIMGLMIRDPLPICTNNRIGTWQKFPISILKKNIIAYWTIHVKKFK